jgi:hypothetical protein
MKEIDVALGKPMKSEGRNRWFGCGAWLLAWPLPITITAMLLGGVIAGTAQIHSVGDAIALAVFIALFCITARFGYRFSKGCFNASLTIMESEIVVQNPWSSYRVKLEDAKEFSAKTYSYGVGNPTPGITLIRKSEKPIFVWTLANEGFIWNAASDVEKWQPTADKLNALLASIRPAV